MRTLLQVKGGANKDYTQAAILGRLTYDPWSPCIYALLDLL